MQQAVPHAHLGNLKFGIETCAVMARDAQPVQAGARWGGRFLTRPGKGRVDFIGMDFCGQDRAAVTPDHIIAGMSGHVFGHVIEDNDRVVIIYDHDSQIVRSLP
ncbi:hypothetical protein [Novacetimonas maltaceti]|uniref:hypothetical protein n=1 Tax=Novacetimonas maltaceti TaxID=1203393 RepID=UPI00142E77DC|nr:hypothetical protein [Novacetimonas maltaceti]